MKEAARTSNDLLAQTQSKVVFKDLEREDPFVEDENQVICHMGYFYRIFDLGKEKKMCIRSTVHSYLEKTNERVNLYVLPEWSEKRQQWGKNLD